MMTNPTGHLVPPSPQDDSVKNGFVNVTSIIDYVSPSAWINDLIADLTGYDVYGKLVQPFAGDWAAVSTYGDALRKMSRCLGEVATQVQSNSGHLDRGWDGNAADSAYMYFASTAGSLSAHARLLERAGDQYQAMAVSVWVFGEQVKSLLLLLSDQALLAAVYAAAGTVTAETGVGAVVGYGLAAAAIAKMLQTINRAARIIQTANMVISTFFSTISGITKELADLGSIPAPGASYIHPMVR